MSRFTIAALACALLALRANATPVQFTWTTTVDNITPAVPIPGVSFGDPVIVEIIADNGSSSLASQSWLLSDLISAQLTIATYSATFVDAFIPTGGQPVFQTDASGALSSVLFVGTGVSAANTDNFGTGARLLNNSVKDSQGRDAYFVDRFVGPLGFVGWDPTPDVVPEPSTTALLFGLVALAMRRSK